MNTNPAATTILCYGDSNTWGTRHDKRGRYAADVRWTGVLQQALGDEFYVIEEGLSSRTTDLEYVRKPGRNGRTYLEPCLDTHGPLDVVVVMLGTNDMKIEFDRTAQQIADATRGLVQLIADKTSKDAANPAKEPAKIVIVSPIFMNEEARYFRDWYEGFYDTFSVEKARRLAPLLKVVAYDIGCAFVDAASVARPGDDGLHMDEASHRALGALLAEKVRSLL